MTCRTCNVSTASYITNAVDPITSDLFAVTRCPSCGIGLTEPSPSELDRYYPRSYYGARHGVTASWCVSRRVGFVRALLGQTRGSLLDVGCGDGEFLSACARDGWTVVGTERSANPARRLYPVYSDIRDAAEHGPFRCITIWHVLEHLDNPLECLSALQSQLDPDGYLLIAVPDFGGLQAKCFGRHWLHLDVPRHLTHFSQESLDRHLGEAGFQRAASWHLELEYDWLGWIQSAENVILRKPNVLFDALTGKPSRAGTLRLGMAFIGAAILAAPTLGLTLLSAACRRGGTLVVAARKHSLS